MTDALFRLRLPHPSGMILVDAFDANRVDQNTGHSYIDISVRQNRKTIFPKGALFCAVNRWTAIDGIEAKELVLSTVAVRPGDTDRDYFDDYTAEQLAWAEEYGEFVGLESERRYCDPETGAIKT